jgi:hypothetical protein
MSCKIVLLEEVLVSPNVVLCQPSPGSVVLATDEGVMEQICVETDSRSAGRLVRNIPNVYCVKSTQILRLFVQLYFN